MLLGFKKRFAPKIQIGSKVHTLRKPRKREPKIGETLHMYTGLRTSKCEIITNKERLMSTQKARVFVQRLPNTYVCMVMVDGRMLAEKELHEFVKFDGFDSIKDFCDYWLTDEKGKKVLKAGGMMNLYHWTDLRY